MSQLTHGIWYMLGVPHCFSCEYIAFIILTWIIKIRQNHCRWPKTHWAIMWRWSPSRCQWWRRPTTRTSLATLAASQSLNLSPARVISPCQASLTGCQRNSCSHQTLRRQVRHYEKNQCDAEYKRSLCIRGPWSNCPATSGSGYHPAWEGRGLQQGRLCFDARAHHLPPIPIHTHQPPHVQGGGKGRGTSRLDTYARCVKYPSKHCSSWELYTSTMPCMTTDMLTTLYTNPQFRSHHTPPLTLLVRRSGTVGNSAPIVIRTSMRCLWKGTSKMSTSEIRTPMSYVLR